MAVRQTSSSSSSGSMIKIIAFVVVVGIVFAGVYFFFMRGSSPSAPIPAAPQAGTAVAPQAGTTAPTEPQPDLSPEQLRKEASTAMREQRLVFPPGNNALEYYLRVLDKEPNSQSARDALRESFPIMTGAVEQDINTGQVDEATRVINLLAKADPSNYTLTILRSKLDAKKKTVDRDLAVAAAAAAAAAAPANTGNAQTAAAAAAAAAAANNAAQTPPQTAAAAPPPVAASTPKPVEAAAPKPVAPPPVAEAAAGADSHPAEILKAQQPDYPPDAVRKRQEGWVEVEFTVTATGQVADVSVVNAQPARVFNAAAIRAVQRWTFRAKTESGKAVDERMKRRIEFKLGG